MVLYDFIDETPDAEGDELPDAKGGDGAVIGQGYNDIPLPIKVPSHNLASRVPSLVLAVANADMGLGSLFVFYPQTNLSNNCATQCSCLDIQ